MTMLFKHCLRAGALAAGLLLAGGAYAQSALTVTFADPTWTGDKVPDGQQCSDQGGHGMTPALEISGVPDGTTSITESYNDETFEGMNHGGHGVLGFAVTPADGKVSVPSAPGETSQLPAGISVVTDNRTVAKGGVPGFKPPCSGAKNHLYTVDVSALDASGKVLATAHLPIGTY